VREVPEGCPVLVAAPKGVLTGDLGLLIERLGSNGRLFQPHF